MIKVHNPGPASKFFRHAFQYVDTKMEQRKRVKLASFGNVEDTETEGAACGWGVGGIHGGRSDLTQTSRGSNYGPPKISRIFVRQERRGCGNMWSLSAQRDPCHLRQPGFEKCEGRGQEEGLLLHNVAGCTLSLGSKQVPNYKIFDSIFLRLKIVFPDIQR